MRNKHLNAEVDEYLKRIKPFAKVEIIEVSATPFRTDGEVERAKDKEGERITGVIQKQRGDVFLLAEGGREFDSKEFAEFLAKHNEPVTFVIGGTAGFSSALKKTYKSLSLSRLTFPHELARAVLVEQLYRAVTMQQKRNKYHY